MYTIFSHFNEKRESNPCIFNYKKQWCVTRTPDHFKFGIFFFKLTGHSAQSGNVWYLEMAASVEPKQRTYVRYRRRFSQGTAAPLAITCAGGRGGSAWSGRQRHIQGGREMQRACTARSVEAGHASGSEQKLSDPISDTWWSCSVGGRGPGWQLATSGGKKGTRKSLFLTRGSFRKSKPEKIHTKTFGDLVDEDEA